jgi:PKD repeat protein
VTYDSPEPTLSGHCSPVIRRPRAALIGLGSLLAVAGLLLATPAQAHFTMTFNGASGQPALWQEDAFTVSGNWTPDAGATVNPGNLETGTWLAGGDYIAGQAGQSSNWIEFTRQGVPFTPISFQIAARSGSQVLIASTGVQIALTGGVGDTFSFPSNDPDWTDVDWLVLYTISGSLGIDTFTIAVCPDPRIWGPYTVAEGGGVLVSGYAEGNSQLFLWDLDNDGAYDDATSWSAVFSAAALDGPASLSIGLQVTADCGLSGTVTGSTSTAVTVTNVAPSIDSLAGASNGDEGTALSWTVSWSDPGSLDTHTILWDPGDGGGPRSGGDTFVHSYTQDGTYVVSVTISDDDGESATDMLSVTVANVAPSPSGLVVPTGNEGETLSFSVSVSDPGSEDVVSTLWSFGDGSTATGSTSVQHTYADDGSYTVSFTASDDDGGSNSVSATATVANLAPVISQVSVPASATEGALVSLSAAASDVPTDPLSYTWDFGDGSAPQTGNPLTHSWNDDGSYTISVTVSDGDGGLAVDSRSIAISNATPSIDSSSFPGGVEGAPLVFSVQASDPGNDTLSYLWDFGDGTATGSSASIPHAFGNEGTYPVSVTVTDDDGASVQLSQNVQILNAAPVIDSLSGNTSGLEGQTLNWTAQVSDPGTADTVTGSWDFGDGTATAAGFSASHSFSNNGSFLVTFTATDDAGATASQSISVTVNNEGPSITSLSVPVGDEGQLLSFSATAVDAGNDTLSYAWNFGDTTAVTTGNPVSHSYDDDGNYEVTLVVTDEDNGTATATGSALIANLPPLLDSLSAPGSGDEGEQLLFEATGSDPGPVDNTSLIFTWDFGDGSSPQTGASTSHAFVDNGTWQVTVLVDDGEGGTSAGTQTVTTHNLAPSIISTAPSLAVEGSVYSYLPSAIEPGTDPLTWTLAAFAPAGVVFDPSTGRVTWTPDYGDAVLGTAAMTITVDDGDGGSDLQTWTVAVASADDDDDGIADGWELLNGLDPTVFGDADLDPDGDGHSNVEEFLAGTDPHSFDGPDAPTLLSPSEDEEVTSSTPYLVAGHSIDPQGDPLSYQFDLYSDAGLTVGLAAGSSNPVLGDEGRWKVDVLLPENATVFWRARASDGSASGPYSAVASFFVNEENERPEPPQAVYPIGDETVSTAATVLQWLLSTDPDRDALSYLLEVHDQSGELVAEGETGVLDEEDGSTQSWTLSTPLEEDQAYSWQVAALDEHGSQGDWSEAEGFFVSRINTVPQGTRFLYPSSGDELEDLTPVLSAEQGVDPDGEVVECLFEFDPAAEIGSSEYASWTVAADASGIVEWDLAETGFELPENRRVYARIRCYDGNVGGSVPDVIDFFVRGANDPPWVPTLLSPAAGAQPGNRSALLEATGQGDPEKDLVLYEFVVARDQGLEEVLSASGPIMPSAADEQGTEHVSWSTATISGAAFWSARGVDEHGAASDWAEPRPVIFPQEPLVEPAASGGCSTGSIAATGLRPKLLPLLALLVLMARPRRRPGLQRPATRCEPHG